MRNKITKDRKYATTGDNSSQSLQHSHVG